MNQSDHKCPTQTIVNAVFGINAGGVPDEIADGVRACKKCFAMFYGEHLDDKTLAFHMDRFTMEEGIHFAHCVECERKYFRIHPRPNKMGVSSNAYKEMITT